MSNVNEIVSKTKSLAFPEGNVLPNPFTTHGGGGEQTTESVRNATGKELQESYRSGFGQSAEYTEKVTGR